MKLCLCLSIRQYRWYQRAPNRCIISALLQTFGPRSSSRACQKRTPAAQPDPLYTSTATFARQRARLASAINAANIVASCRNVRIFATNQADWLPRACLQLTTVRPSHDIQ